MSESRGFEMWGFAASVVGTIFLVPYLYAWTTGGLPSQRMRYLENILSETETLLRSALEEGTIDYRYYERKIHEHMWQAKVHADDVRAQVYNINSQWQEIKCWLTGLSGRITTVIDALHEIRGVVATSNSRGRHKLVRMGCTANPTLVAYSRDSVSHLMLPVPPPRSAATARSTARTDSILLSQDASASPLGHHQLVAPTTSSDTYSGPNHAKRTVPPIRFSTIAFKTKKKCRNTPLKLYNSDTSHFRTISSFSGGATAILPCYTGSSPTPAFRSVAHQASGDTSSWGEKGPVVAQVQFPA